MNKKLKINIFKNQYIINTNTWTLDKTFLGNKICLCVVVNLKSRAIIAYVYKKLTINEINKTIKNKDYNIDYKVGLISDEILDLYQTMLE